MTLRMILLHENRETSNSSSGSLGGPGRLGVRLAFVDFVFVPDPKMARNTTPFNHQAHPGDIPGIIYIVLRGHKSRVQVYSDKSQL